MQTVVRTLTMSMDASALGAGDVAAATQELPEVVKQLDGGAYIDSLTVIDKDDNGVALDVWIMDSNVAIGTENSLPNISDANAESILAKIAVAAADYSDLGGVKVATVNNLRIAVKPASGSSSIYVAIVNGASTPTYTAAGVVLRFGIVQG